MAKLSERRAQLEQAKAAYDSKDPRDYVTLIDMGLTPKGMSRESLMALAAKQNPDPFDIMIKESTMAQIRRQKQSGRRATFFTGPRGLEGPMSSLIAGGGTSLMGS